MRLAISYVAVLGAVSTASAADSDSYWGKPLVESLALQLRVKLDNLMNHAKALEAIAYNTTDRNRVLGSPGHEGTVKYIYDQLTQPSLEGYYNVALQEFTARVQKSGTASLFLNGKNTTISVGTFSPSATFNASLALTANLGCNETDYPAPITGKIALISRGTCSFADKSSIAGKFGAVAAVIFNNKPENLGEITLNEKGNTKFGPVIPTVGISGTEGTALANSIKAGSIVTAAGYVKTVIGNVTTNNVLAQSKYGDQNNILQLGAHSDSVAEGPGINDDGSGTSSLIEVAKLLASYRIRNSVRFSWWSGEEEGLLGSEYYVRNLTAAEKKKIRLYLNFDMMASPNYQYEIFDGDGSTFNVTGPAGSDSIEELFEDYFESRDLNYTAGELDGRSDYASFQDAGIPVGGLATGAEKNKTKEGAEKFGGEAGKPFDQNYHQAGDNVSNLNTTAFLVNSQAIGHAVATYSRSFNSVDFNETTTEVEEPEKKKRDVVRRARTGLKKPKSSRMGLKKKSLPKKRKTSRVFV